MCPRKRIAKSLNMGLGSIDPGVKKILYNMPNCYGHFCIALFLYCDWALIFVPSLRDQISSGNNHNLNPNSNLNFARVTCNIVIFFEFFCVKICCRWFVQHLPLLVLAYNNDMTIGQLEDTTAKKGASAQSKHGDDVGCRGGWYHLGDGNAWIWTEEGGSLNLRGKKWREW